MEYSLYSLKTLFNTHVGSGQNSYGIVDNIVQKDYLTQFPCINSSSLKGSLREWVEKRLNKEPDARIIFGDSDKTENGKEGQSKTNKPGTHHFFQAFLLSYPMRSDKVQFFNVTCPRILNEFKAYLNDFGITKFNAELDNLIKVIDQPISLNGIADATVELHSIKSRSEVIDVSDDIKKMFGENILIMNNDDFNKIINKLPIITRNHLDNGQSINLF